jgi:hypothetical protein
VILVDADIHVPRLERFMRSLNLIALGLMLALTTSLTACSKKGGGGGASGAVNPTDEFGCFDVNACGGNLNAPYYGSGKWQGMLTINNQAVYSELMQMLQPIQCFAYPCVQQAQAAFLKARIMGGYGQFTLYSNTNGHWGQGITKGGRVFRSNNSNGGFVINHQRNSYSGGYQYNGGGYPAPVQPPAIRVVGTFNGVQGQVLSVQLVFRNTVVAQGYLNGYLQLGYGGY